MKGETIYMYHFSPKTSKPEICVAFSPANCPYSDCPHSQDKTVIQDYADKENELLSKLVDRQAKYFSSNLMSYTEIPYVLSKTEKSIPELKINRDTYNYLGLTISQIKDLDSYSNVYIVPQNPRFIQAFLRESDGLNLCYKDFEEGYSTRLLKAPIGKPYDKWDALPYIDATRLDTSAGIMDKKIRTTDPHGNHSYTLTSMWNDYIELKQLKKEIIFIKKRNNRFYIIFGNL